MTVRLQHVICLSTNMIHGESLTKCEGTNTWLSEYWQVYKLHKKKMCTDDANFEQHAFFCNCAIVETDRQETGRQADLWAAREWFKQISLCLAAPPLPSPSLFSHSPFSKLPG